MPDLKFDAENCDKSLKIIGKTFEDCCDVNIPGRREISATLSQYLRQILSHTKTEKDTGPLKKLAGHIKFDQVNNSLIFYNLYAAAKTTAVTNDCGLSGHLHEVLSFLFGGNVLRESCKYVAASDDLDPFNLPSIDFLYCLYNVLHCRTYKTQLYESSRKCLQLASNSNRGAVLCFNVNKLKYWIPEIEIDGNWKDRCGMAAEQANSGLIPIKINSTSSDDKLEFDFVRLPREFSTEKIGSLIVIPEISLQDKCMRVISNGLTYNKYAVDKLPLPIKLQDLVKERCELPEIDYSHIWVSYFEALADELAAPSTDIEEGRVEALSLQDQHAVALVR